MDPLGALAIILAFSIPILVIASKFTTRWLAIRAGQGALGTPNRELELKVERLERANAESAKRIENLEAIVAGKTWTVLDQPGLSETAQQPRLAAARPQDLRAPSPEELNRQRAAELAGRLGG